MLDLGHDFESASLFMHAVESAIRHGARFKVLGVEFSYRDEIMTIRVAGQIGRKLAGVSSKIDKRQALSCPSDAVRPHVDRIIFQMNELASKQAVADAKAGRQPLEVGS